MLPHELLALSPFELSVDYWTYMVEAEVRRKQHRARAQQIRIALQQGKTVDTAMLLNEIAELLS